jgi:GT2 family glycosyltransferase
MTFHRADILAVGGFDPSFLASYDDVDFQERRLASGRTMVLHPGAVVYHTGGTRCLASSVSRRVMAEARSCSRRPTPLRR